MERPADTPARELDKARLRVLGYYRHLFPELRERLESDDIAIAPTVALDPAFHLSPESVGKGWTSQPQVPLPRKLVNFNRIKTLNEQLW